MIGLANLKGNRAMRTAMLTLTVLATAIACWLPAVPARAQPIRVFVSNTGLDSNPCTFAQPCKSAQHAHDTVAAGGELRMLDPASYGLMTITKAISILGDGHGGIAASGGSTAITINAGANDKINIRGFLLEGFGTGNNGVTFNSGASLNIQECMIRNFAGGGINFTPNASSKLSVSHTLVSDIGGNFGISIVPTGSGTVFGILNHVEINNITGGQGLLVNGQGSSGVVKISITDSVIANNGTNALTSQSQGAAPTAVVIRNSTIANNSSAGLVASGGSASILVTRTTITGNGTGFNPISSGALSSYGDNNLDGNTTAGSPTSTLGYH